MQIRYQSTVIFVKDIQASRRFYEELLCQPVTLDSGEYIAMGKGFALWKADYALQTIFGRASQDGGPLGRQNVEVYFEAEDLDAAWMRLAQANALVKIIHPIHEHPWGQRAFRVYDPDGHIVEIGEPMSEAIRRFLAGGMTVEEVAAKTGMPLEMVMEVAAAPAG